MTCIRRIASRSPAASGNWQRIGWNSAYFNISIFLSNILYGYNNNFKLMGIDIRWENERGQALATFSDSNFLIERFLPRFDAREFPLLRHIDPYGDTTFNQSQIPDVISELERISQKRHEPKVERHLKDVLKFIRKAQGEIHTYIKFYGD